MGGIWPGCNVGGGASRTATVTVSGWTVGCCVLSGQSVKPQAALYGTWGMTPTSVAPFFDRCFWRFSAGNQWMWDFYPNVLCSGSIVTNNRTLTVFLRLLGPSRTGNGETQWQFDMGNPNDAVAVFRGRLLYGTTGSCGSPMTFTNNGYHEGGTLRSGCGVGGSATIEFT